MKLENSDANILLTILQASESGKKNVTIGHIISGFDFMNHGIVTYDEMKGALSRLTTNNYISEPDDLQFLPSRSINDEFTSYKKKNKRLNFIAELEFIQNLIDAKEWSKDFDPVKANASFNYKGFTPEIYQGALRTYLGK